MLCLEMIVDHAKGKEPSVPGYVCGLIGYDTWVDALCSNQIDLLDHYFIFKDLEGNAIMVK